MVSLIRDGNLHESESYQAKCRKVTKFKEVSHDILSKYLPSPFCIAMFLEARDVNALCQVNRNWTNYNVIQKKSEQHFTLTVLAYVREIQRQDYPVTNEKCIKVILNQKHLGIPLTSYIQNLYLINDEWITKNYETIKLMPNLCTLSIENTFLSMNNRVPHLPPFNAGLVVRQDFEFCIKSLSVLKCLRILNLNLLDNGLTILSRLTSLQSLEITDTKSWINGSFISALTPLTELKSLTLSCTAITDAGIAEISKLTALETLSLANSQRIVGVSLSSLTNLTSLNLSWDFNIEASCLSTLVRLRSLNLSNCTGVCDGSLRHLIPLTNLKDLNLGNCWNIMGGSLSDLCHLPELTNLNLMGCRQLMDMNLSYLHCSTALKSLNLAGCSSITDDGLAYLSFLTGLHTLLLCYCEITDAGIAKISMLTSLRNLDLTGCQQITNKEAYFIQPFRL